MSATSFAATPEPPYYAVVFSSQRTAEDRGYAAVADRMVELAAKVPGYLGIESARGADRFGITVSYWRDLEAVERWRTDVEHLAAQRRGRNEWYEHFELRIAKVERASSGPS